MEFFKPFMVRIDRETVRFPADLYTLVYPIESSNL
jgi:hypothetical protein